MITNSIILDLSSVRLSCNFNWVVSFGFGSELVLAVNMTTVMTYHNLRGAVNEYRYLNIDDGNEHMCYILVSYVGLICQLEYSYWGKLHNTNININEKSTYE